MSVRASNCLENAGYTTVGKLVDKINTREDLKKLRNCGEKTMELDYKQILNAVFMDDHLVLCIQKNMMLFVAYDGFTKGTFSEFKQFLREKRPDLKIPE